MTDDAAQSGAYVALRVRVASALADAAGDGVFDRDDPDCTSDDEDRAYWLRLADAALAVDHAPSPGVRAASVAETVERLMGVESCEHCGEPKTEEHLSVHVYTWGRPTPSAPSEPTP